MIGYFHIEITSLTLASDYLFVSSCSQALQALVLRTQLSIPVLLDQHLGKRESQHWRHDTASFEPGPVYLQKGA